MSKVTVYNSWSAARLWALVIVLGAFVLIWLAVRLLPRDAPERGGLLNGYDNRWSTSKVSIVLWTIALVWAFVALLLRYGSSAVPQSVPGSYFALLGIPSAAALGAKAVTNHNVEKGAPKKKGREKPNNNPISGIGEIFADDTGAPDLLDSQYFLFNLVLLGYFIAAFFHLAAPVGSNIMLPALPGSLLALAGVSGASYLGKKALSEGPTKEQAAKAASAANGTQGGNATAAAGDQAAAGGAGIQTDPDFSFVGIPPVDEENG